MFRSIRKSGLRKELTVAFVFLLVVTVVLTGLLARQNSHLKKQVQDLETAQERIMGIVEGRIVAQVEASVAERCDELDSVSINEYIRQIDVRTGWLPKDVTDFGAAMEGTVQWEGVKAQLGRHEESLFSQDSRGNDLEADLVAINGRFLRDNTNLSEYDERYIDWMIQVTRERLFDTFELVMDGTVRVMSVQGYIPSSITISGALLEPSTYTDTVPVWTAPVYNGQLRVTAEGTPFNIPIQPGQALDILIHDPAFVSFEVADYVYMITEFYCGNIETGELSTGYCD
ncbi:hypothetical protein JXA34_00045 [Patescibacteria group bacterium]|nr:hypothetical protein [Patescibacteria group bacterium]